MKKPIDLVGYWHVEDTHTDIPTGFLVTKVHRVYGDLRDAFEGTLFHRNTQQVRITWRGTEETD